MLTPIKSPPPPLPPLQLHVPIIIMVRPPKHKSRFYSSPSPKPTHLFLLLLLLLLLFILLVSFLLLFFLSLHLSTIFLPQANSLGRRCFPTELETPSTQRLRMVMVSLSDEGGDGAADRRRRSFRGLMNIVRFNKESYARRWGYRFVDAGRNSVDSCRPASWSKILAVRKHLDASDWVFWNDADSMVTNPEVRLERILQSVLGQSDLTDSPELVVTEDVNGINAGMWFLKRSKWSHAFLDTWWNQTDFIQFGSTRSGDNAALIHIIKSMSAIEHHRHVHVASSQCLFNSYPWVPTWKNTFRLITSPRSIWRGVYSDGDFMVHLAGIDDKKEWTVKILQGLR